MKSGHARTPLVASLATLALLLSAQAAEKPTTPTALELQVQRQCVDPLTNPEFNPNQTKALTRASESPLERMLEATDRGHEAVLALDKQSMEVAMTELGIHVPTERAVFLAAIELKPLFESGVVYQAIAEEFFVRGFKKQKDAINLARHFALLPVAEKQAIIENVFQRIFYRLDDHIELGNFASLEARARAFKMSTGELAVFLRKWRRLRESEYEEAKLVLLDMFYSGSNKFIGGVANAHSLYTGFSWFGLRRKLRPIQTPALNSLGGFDTAGLMKYLEGTHASMREYFIERNAGRLSKKQILELKESNIWKNLSDRTRTVLLRQLQIAEKKSEVAVLKERIKIIRKSLEILKDGVAPPPANPANPELLISQLQATGSYRSHEATHEVIQNVLSKNRKHLHEKDYSDVALAALAEIGRYRSSEWHRTSLITVLKLMPNPVSDIEFRRVALGVLKELRRNSSHAMTYEVFHEVVKQARKRQISADTETAIKKSITDHVRFLFNSTAYTNSSLFLLTEPWAKSPKTLEELQLEEVELTKRLEAAKKELEQLKKAEF